MFVDLVNIKVEAGSGGDGITAFRREKFVSLGGPYGGSGGRGANIIFKTDEGLNTLIDLRYRKIIKAPKGGNGQGKNMHGRDAEDVVIKVPVGTIIKDLDTNLIVADLNKKNQEVIVASGGRGGRGNSAFKTHTNPAPEISENGEPGEIRNLQVELKLLADVGLVGLPSVGKSTILSKTTKSKPKIAAYHFTTLSPNLGVVKTSDERVFVIADLPGLIENASKGEGLGDQFLRHIERTKIIAHVIDMGSSELRDPYEDYVLINNELEQFSKKLIKKPQIIIANKMDLEGSDKHLEAFKKKVKEPIIEISALNEEGLDKLLLELANLVDEYDSEDLFEDEMFESHVLYKFKEETPYTIEKVGEYTWEITGKDIETLFRMTKFTSQEAIFRFARKLRKLGVDDKLKELGAKDGDLVTINGVKDFTFDYTE